MVCQQCHASFTVTQAEQAFYEKITPVFGNQKYPLPLPIHCPDCRKQRRLAFRNERNLYKRSCNLCQASIISIYSPDKAKLVYCAKCYWSDHWNAFDYGQDIDFTQPFFPQFKKLFDKVPALALILDDIENSDYNNSCASLKNCYLCFDGGMAQDCGYGETFNYVKDCYNFLVLQEGELCYECINCLNCYNLAYSQFCQNCSDSYFLQDCVGCKNCFGCTNLNSKEYYWFNEPKTEAEFKRLKSTFQAGSYSAVEAMRKKVVAFWQQQPKRNYRGTMNDNATGDNIIHCHNSFANFDCRDTEDCGYCQQVILPAKDCYDLDKWGNNISLVYNGSGIGNNCQQVVCSYYTAFNATNIYHSVYCWYSCSDLFGCVGLNRQKSHCILNKQYSPQEYAVLAGKLAAHMQSTGEWGQFFPPDLSVFGYNETEAQIYYPLTRDEALQKGYQWSDYVPPTPDVKHKVLAVDLPNDIKDIPDTILETAIECSNTKKLFVITKQELAFYRRQNIPLPRLHPIARNAFLRQQKNPQKLWQRNCAECHSIIHTAYSPESNEKVLCEKCYSQSII